MPQRAHVKPELLKWARETMHLSLEEAESRIHPSVSKWEAGEAEPTVRQLRDACRVYKRPLAAFFLPSPPTTFRVPHDYRRVPGEPAPRLSPEFLGEFRAASYRRRVALEVAGDGEIAAEISELVGSVSIKRSPENVAPEYREKLLSGISSTRWSTSYDAFNAWRQSVENLGVLVTHFSGVEVDDVRGYAITDTPLPIIGLNSSDAVNARIFTLLHEFGHLLLGKPGVSNLKESPSVVSADQRIEQWCNAFAAEALVPSDDFLAINEVKEAEGEQTLDDAFITALAKKFFVSRYVVLARLVKLGKVSPGFYWTKSEEYRKTVKEAASESTGFMRHHLKIVRRVGKPFARIVVGAYDREAITASDLAEYLGMRLKHLGNVREALSTSQAGTDDTAE